MDCSLVLFCAFLLFTIIHCPQLSVLSTMSHHRNPLAYSSVYVPLDLRKRIVESWTLNEGNVWELSIRYKVGSQAIARYIDRYIQGHPLTLILNYPLHKTKTMQNIIKYWIILPSQRLLSLR
eukprot:1146841_1